MIEERLQQIIDGRQQPDLRQRIGPQQRGGFQPQTRRAEQWTVDPFWDLDRPTSAQPSQQEQPDIDRQPDKIQTLRQHTNRENTRGMERVTVHKPSDQRRYNRHRSLERTTAHKHTDQWRNNRHRSLERTTAHKHTDQRRNNRHTYKQHHKQPPIGLAKQQPIVEGGMWSMLDRNF